VKRRALIWSAAGLVALLGVAAAIASSTTEPDTKVLLQGTASWNDVPYASYPLGQPQLTTVRITIPAHSALPWHTHVMPNAAYLLSGSLTVEERGTGRKAHYRAGEAFAESVGNVHRGVTGSEPAVVIVTYAGAVGKPLSMPVEGAHG